MELGTRVNQNQIFLLFHLRTALQIMSVLQELLNYLHDACYTRSTFLNKLKVLQHRVLTETALFHVQFAVDCSINFLFK